MDQETSIHHHPITLTASLGIARKIVGEEKEKKGDSRAYPGERCEAKEGCALIYGSAPSITSPKCRLSIRTFVIKDSSAFGKAFPLFKDNPVHKEESYDQSRGA